MVVRKTEHTPVPVSALPEFTPVPRQYNRHDGWTPERQRAFIAALADTGCVSIAARMVNMSQAAYYQLRRQPGAESFRAAADAAQTLGLQPIKDEAFHRAMHGELIPVFVGGKLAGFRRKKNDRLLMFILRHYGQDQQGRKTTINYFSTRATAGAAAQSPSPLVGEGRGGGSGSAAAGSAAAESSTTTVKTVITGAPAQSPALALEDSAALLESFQGVDLDAEARDQIQRTLLACAERRRAAEVDHSTPRAEAFDRQVDDEQCDFIRVPPGSLDFAGELVSGLEAEDFEPLVEGETPWELLGADKPEWLVEWEERQAAKALPAPETNQSAPGFPGEGDHPEGGGGAAASEAEAPPKAKRPYKPCTPKPRFKEPDAAAYEARKAKAAKEVEAERCGAAAAEAKRREQRKSMS